MHGWVTTAAVTESAGMRATVSRVPDGTFSVLVERLSDMQVLAETGTTAGFTKRTITEAKAYAEDVMMAVER